MGDEPVDQDEALDPQIARRYEVIKKVGKGAYGVVFKATDRETQQQIALKKVFRAFQNATDSLRAYREITILRQLRNHPFIVGLLAVHRAENDSDLYLVFECMETDVHGVIRAGILLDIHQRYIFWQLCCALKHMHSAGVIHRDLKPSNILIRSDALIKVCDFGLSRAFDSSSPDAAQEQLTDYIATRWYRSPEILFESSNYGVGIDMWATGCILAELVSGRPLFPGASTLDQLERIVSFTGQPSQADIESMRSSFTETLLGNLTYTRPKMILDEKLSGACPEAIDLVGKLLQWNPDNRPSAEECLAHPYVVQFHSLKREISAPAKVVMALPDSKHFTAREYRNQIYREAVTPPDAKAKKPRRTDQEPKNS
jgi:mitogen-activated protein kinase 15